MNPHTTTEVTGIGANGWREAAEVLAHAREISRQAADRVREAIGEPPATAHPPEPPAPECKPAC